MILKSRYKKLDLKKTRLMGVLNLTPDSFSDGGKYDSVDKAVKRFDRMVAEGADIIDIGGESTGPGSNDVSAEEELGRILPVLKAVRGRSDVWISVDTYKAEVAQAAIKYGADMINDILALRGDPDMGEVIAEAGVSVCMMYSKDSTGRTTRENKKYKNVIKHIKDFFKERVEYADKAGIKKENIILDPGQGAFIGDDPAYSLQILKRLGDFNDLGLPLLIGSSRKSFIGKVLGTEIENRLEGSLACACIAIINGVSIIRAHDVKETRRVIDMTDAVINC